MSKSMQKEMNDLFTTYSFGGGGSSGGNSRRTLGPGGGSDPGNHPSARTGDAMGTGPLSRRQRTAVRVGGTLVAAAPASYPVKAGGALVGMFGGGN